MCRSVTPTRRTGAPSDGAQYCFWVPGELGLEAAETRAVGALRGAEEALTEMRNRSGPGCTLLE